MITRNAKMAYYMLLRIPMRMTGWLYRNARAPKPGNSDCVKVHLGPGQKNYLEGWINVDANIVSAKCDVWANLNDPLPFAADSVDIFYSHHVIEHLPDSQLLPHFKNMYACLKPGGTIRVGGPNGDMAIRKYLAGDTGWFGNFPDAHDSIGGKLKNFIFCRNEHLTILTPSYLDELLKKAGFENVDVCVPGQTTSVPQYVDATLLAQESWSSPSEPHTLIVECRKPKNSPPA